MSLKYGERLKRLTISNPMYQSILDTCELSQLGIRFGRELQRIDMVLRFEFIRKSYVW